MSDAPIPVVEGGAIEKKIELVALRWSGFPLRQTMDGKVSELPGGEISKGVYAIEGCHDAHVHHTVLYIGSSPKQVLSDRLLQSVDDLFFDKSADRRKGTSVRPYADVWNLTLRWAPVHEESLVEPIERLLIIAHSPPFNSKHVRRRWAQGREIGLLVLNTGFKGRLMPAVSGHYHARWARP